RILVASAVLIGRRERDSTHPGMHKIQLPPADGVVYRLGHALQELAPAPDRHFPETHCDNRMVSIFVTRAVSWVPVIDELRRIEIHSLRPRVMAHNLHAVRQALLELCLEGVVAITGIVPRIARVLGPTEWCEIRPSLVGRESRGITDECRL